jgi:hypothetical protein
MKFLLLQVEHLIPDIKKISFIISDRDYILIVVQNPAEDLATKEIASAN